MDAAVHTNEQWFYRGIRSRSLGRFCRHGVRSGRRDMRRGGIHVGQQRALVHGLCGFRPLPATATVDMTINEFLVLLGQVVT